MRVIFQSHVFIWFRSICCKRIHECIDNSVFNKMIKFEVFVKGLLSKTGLFQKWLFHSYIYLKKLIFEI